MRRRMVIICKTVSDFVRFAEERWMDLRIQVSDARLGASGAQLIRAAEGILAFGFFWSRLGSGARLMEVQLTSDQLAFARRAVEAGRLSSEESAVQEALALWEERERRRLELQATIDDSREALARGEGRVITQQSVRELSAEVKERGRARLLAELAHAK
jgi:Arc/MetJ-type ribon-helix-helix transcriptional regulator